MRRLVDSIIFLLIAYSVCWPLARSLTGEPPATGRRIEFAVRVAGCDVVPAARIRVAASEQDAHAGRFRADARQRAGTAGAGLELPDAGDPAWIDSAWIVVELPGRTLAPRPLAPAQLAPASAGDGSRDRTVVVEVPADAAVVVGQAPAACRRIQVTMPMCEGSAAFDVPCDAAGRFVFLMPEDRADAATMQIANERGRWLADRVAPSTAGIHDVGLIDA